MIKDSPKGEITKFEDYVKKYCDVTVENANEYAKKGKALLVRIHNEEITAPISDEELVKESAHLMWYLIKRSFEVGHPFGKGMFVVQMPSDQETERLYEYFRHGRVNLYTEKTVSDSKKRAKESLQKTAKSMASKSASKITFGLVKNEVDTNPTYSRTSSHFNAFMLKPEDGHFGIDANKDAPLPLTFKTLAFGLISGEKIKDTNNKNGLYLKPETEGADTLRNPGGTVSHGANLAKTKVFGGQKISGLGRFAEDKDGYGNAVRFKFTGKSLKALNAPKKMKKVLPLDEEIEKKELLQSEEELNPIIQTVGLEEQQEKIDIPQDQQEEIFERKERKINSPEKSKKSKIDDENEEKEQIEKNIPIQKLKKPSFPDKRVEFLGRNILGRIEPFNTEAEPVKIKDEKKVNSKKKK